VFSEERVMFAASVVLLCSLQAATAQRHFGCRNSTGRHLTWTGAEYRFECEAVDAMLRDRGLYVPKNNIALRGQICGDELYLAYPR